MIVEWAPLTMVQFVSFVPPFFFTGAVVKQIPGISSSIQIALSILKVIPLKT